MQLVKLEAENFCCFESLELDLKDQGLVWIGGNNLDSDSATNNGSGKSTIFKALTWCLYGNSIDGVKGDKVIRDNCKQAKVKIKIEDGKDVCEIIRTRKKGIPELELFFNGVIFESSKVDLQDKIIEIIGLDFFAFKNTVLYGQSDVTRFANPRTKDAERKEILNRILRIGILKNCHDLALVFRKEIRDKINEIENKISIVKVRLEEQRIEELKTKYDEFESIRKTKSENQKVLAGECKERAYDFLKEAETLKIETRTSLDKIDDKIKTLTSIKDEGELAKVEIEKNKIALNRLEKLFRAKEDESMLVIPRIKILEDRINRLSVDVCPMCESDLRTDKPVKLKIKYENKLETLINELKIINNEKMLIANDIKTNKDNSENLIKIINKGQDAKNEIYKIKDVLNEMKLEEERLENEREKLRDKAKQYIEEARKKIALSKEILSEENIWLEQLKTAEKKEGEFKTSIKELTESLQEENNDLAYNEFWVKGFSNQGLPSFILDSVMPFISKQANHYLEILSDGDIKINFETQRELKSAKGEVKDEINITWIIEGIENCFPSGGQLKKIEIATDFALMDLVATRENNHIDILALDEILDGLDSEGRQRVLLLLQELKSKRNSIFVISHESDIAEIFEKSIVVKKENGVSCIL